MPGKLLLTFCHNVNNTIQCYCIFCFIKMRGIIFVDTDNFKG